MGIALALCPIVDVTVDIGVAGAGDGGVYEGQFYRGLAVSNSIRGWGGGVGRGSVFWCLVLSDSSEPPSYMGHICSPPPRPL